MTMMSTMAASLVLAGAPGTSTWSLDVTHAELGFKVRHMMVSWTRGTFDRFSGTLELDEKDVSKSKVSVSIEVASVNTKVKERDDHLRGPDFFDVEKHPTMTFTSTGFAQKNGRLEVTGQLTIRGVSRKVVLDADPFPAAVKDPWGKWRTGTRATTKLSRKDFGLTWNKALEAGGVAVGDEVELGLDVEFIRQG
ncbi:MAG: YceI family protein [Myxococcaceae bacterium]|nr:YceI family protein [Myxococcaceae bacterium]